MDTKSAIDLPLRPQLPAISQIQDWPATCSQIRILRQRVREQCSRLANLLPFRLLVTRSGACFHSHITGNEAVGAIRRATVPTAIHSHAQNHSEPASDTFTAKLWGASAGS